MLLDDPFSAVDSKVGTKIYHRVLRGLLRRHAVVLVTHHARFGRDASATLNLGRSSTKHAVSRGAGKQTPTKGVEDPVLRGSPEADTDDDAQTDDDDLSDDDTTSPTPTGWQTRRQSKAVIESEHRRDGNVTMSTVKAWVASFGSAPALVFLGVLLVGAQILQVCLMPLPVANFDLDAILLLTHSVAHAPVHHRAGLYGVFPRHLGARL